MKSSPINARQIKAARALLDWSQEQLAEACCLSVATIRKIESGHISPRNSTMGGIQQAFESAGLEFIAPNGVRERPEEITVYEGHYGAINFFDDVYKTALMEDPDIVIVCPDAETFFSHALGDYKAIHVARMINLRDSVTVRCILTQNASAVPGAAYCEYRFLPQSLVDFVPFYVHGHTCSVRPYDSNNRLKIISISSQELADTFRRQFNSMWDKATPLNPPLVKQRNSPDRYNKGKR